MVPTPPDTGLEQLRLFAKNEPSPQRQARRIRWAKLMARMEDYAPTNGLKYRRRMMQVAALAVAACESFDRTHGLAPQ